MSVLKVEKSLYGPYFLAQTQEGLKVKIPRTAPGEIWKGKHLKEDIFQPLTPLRLNYTVRRVGFCGYYPFCGSCQWQHIKPQHQREFKIQLFEEYIGLKPQRVLISTSEEGYRVKTFLYWREGKLGFKKAWFYDIEQPIMDIVHCPLLHPRLNKVLKLLKKVKFPKSLHAVELFTNPQREEVFLKLLFLRKEFPEGDFIKNLVEELFSLKPKDLELSIGIYRGEYLNWERVKVYGNWESLIEVGDYKFLVSPDAFIQPNHYLWREFIQLIKPTEVYKTGLELHAGIGFFTLHLSRYVEKLESSDIGKESSRLRELNLKLNRIRNVESYALDAYKHLKRIKKVDLLVVDPPRGGLTKPVVGLILKKLPKEIIYISCNLESLKKDLSQLREKYEIVKTALVEQFPNTHHIESVVWLKRT